MVEDRAVRVPNKKTPLRLRPFGYAHGLRSGCAALLKVLRIILLGVFRDKISEILL
jgi:hypothetical protein